MQLFDSFANIEQQFNDFNRGIDEAIRSIDRLNSTMIAKSNKFTKHLASFNTFVSATKNVNSVLGLLTGALNTSAEAKKGLGLMSSESAALLGNNTNPIRDNANALGVLTTKTTGLTTAKKLLGGAMKGLGFGLIIYGISALIQGIPKLIEWITRESDATRKLREEQQKLRDSADRLIEASKASAEAHQNRVDSIDAETRTSRSLLDTIKELYSTGDKSLRQKMKLASYTEILSGSVEGLNVQYDIEYSNLTLSIDAIERQINARDRQLRKAAAQERIVALTREQYIATNELAEAEEYRDYLLQKLADSTETQIIRGREITKVNREYQDRLYDQKDIVKDLTALLTEKGREYNDLSRIIIDEMMAAAEALNDYADEAEKALQRAGYACEVMVQTQRKALESLAREYDSLKSHTTNMFSALSNEASLTFDQMLYNMERNQYVVSQWASNISRLAEEGVDDGLLEILRKAGPQSAGYVQELVRGIEKDENGLASLNDTFANGGEAAIDALAKSLGVYREVAETAANLARSTSNSLQQELYDANFFSKGSYVAQGLADGINESAQKAIDAAAEMAKAIIRQTYITFDSNSPSRVFHTIGEGVGQGFLNGFNARNKQVLISVHSFFDGILDVGRSKTDLFKDIGRNMIDSMQQGISDAASRMAEAARSAAQSAINAARNALQISSPSKVFTSFGVNSGESYADGFKSTENYIDRILDGIFKFSPKTPSSSGGFGSAPMFTGNSGINNYNLTVKFEDVDQVSKLVQVFEDFKHSSTVYGGVM